MSCATSWAVVKLWQPLEKPTLAQAEALSSWTMSSAVGTKAPFCSALISAGMPTTVTTARMPVFCAGCCDLQTASSRNLLWPAPLPPGSLPPVTIAVHSALPPLAWERACPNGVVLHRTAWLYPINCCGPNSTRAPTFCSAKTENWGKGMTSLSLVGLQVQHP